MNENKFVEKAQESGIRLFERGWPRPITPLDEDIVLAAMQDGWDIGKNTL